MAENINNIPTDLISPEVEFNLELDTNNRVNKISEDLKLPNFNIDYPDQPQKYFPDFQPIINYGNNKVENGLSLYESVFSENPQVALKAKEILNKKNNANSFIRNDFNTPILTPTEQTKRYTSEDYGFQPGVNNEDFYHTLNWDSKGVINKFITGNYNFFGRVASGAILKFGEGLGYVGSMLSNIGEEDYWSKVADNGFSKALEEAEDWTKEELFKVYKSADYDNKGFFSKMSDATSWQDSFADGVAFLASAFIPGAIFSKLGSLGALGRLGTLARMGEAEAGLVNAESWFARSVAKVAGKSMDAGKIARGTNNAIEMLTGARNGSGIANYAYSIGSEAAFEAADTFKQAKAQLISQGYTEDEANKGASEKASQTYMFNVGILGFSNAFENRLIQKVLNKKGANSFIAHGDDLSVSSDVTKRLESVASDNTWGNRLKLYGRSYGKTALKGFVAEGLWDENAQLAAQRIAQGDYETREVGTGRIRTVKSGNFFEQVLSNIKGAIKGTDIEAQESIGTGALIGVLGGVGTSILTKEVSKEQKSFVESANEMIEARNNWLSNDVYETEEDGKTLKLDANKKPIISQSKVSERDKQLALMTSQLNLAKNTTNPDLRAVVQGSSFAKFALAHIKNGSIDFLIDRLNNWAVQDAETLAAFGFSQELQSDVSPKEYAELAKDLKDIHSSIEENQYAAPQGMNVKEALPLIGLIKSSLYNLRSENFILESLLDNGFQTLSDPKFKDLIAIEANIKGIQESLEVPQDEGGKKYLRDQLKDAETELNKKQKEDKTLTDEYIKVSNQKAEIRQRVEDNKNKIAVLSDRDKALVYAKTELDDYKTKIEKAKAATTPEVKPTTPAVKDNQIKRVDDFLVKHSKVGSVKELKDALNEYYGVNKTKYSANVVRERLLQIYNKIKEELNGNYTDEEKSAITQLLEDIKELGIKNNTIAKVESKSSGLTTSQSTVIIDNIKKRIGELASKGEPYLSDKTNPEYLKILSEQKSLFTRMLSMQKPGYIFTPQDIAEFGEGIGEIVKPSKPIINDIQKQLKLVKPNTTLIETIKQLPYEEIEKDLTFEVVPEVDPTYQSLETNSNDNYKVTFNNPTSAGNPWIAILYKGEILGYLNSPDVFSYTTPNGENLKPENISKEDFEAITQNFSEYPGFISRSKTYRELFNQLVNKVSGFATGLFKIDISEGSYDYTTIESNTISFKDLYEKYPNMVIFNRTKKDKSDNYIYDVIVPEDTNLTTDQIAEAEEFLDKSKETNRYGRYVSVFILPNGEMKIIQLKAPKFTEEQLTTYFDNLKTALTEIDSLSQGKVLSTEDAKAREEIRDTFNNSLTPFIAIDPITKKSKSYLDIEFSILFPKETNKPVFGVVLKSTDKNEKETYITIPTKDIVGKSKEDIIKVINQALLDKKKPFVLTEDSFLMPVDKTTIDFTSALTTFNTNVTNNVFINPTIKIKPIIDNTFTSAEVKKVDNIEIKPVIVIEEPLNEWKIGDKLERYSKEDNRVKKWDDVEIVEIFEGSMTDQDDERLGKPARRIRYKDDQGIITMANLNLIEEQLNQSNEEISKRGNVYSFKKPINENSQVTNTETSTEVKLGTTESGSNTTDTEIKTPIEGLNERLDSYGNAKLILPTNFYEGKRPEGRLNAFKAIITKVEENFQVLGAVKWDEFNFLSAEDKKRLEALKPKVAEFSKLNITEITINRTIAVEKRYAQLTNEIINEFVDIMQSHVQQQLGKTITSSKPKTTTQKPRRGFTPKVNIGKRPESKDSIKTDKLVKEDVDDISQFQRFLNRILPENFFEIVKWNNPQSIFGTSNIRVGNFLSKLDTLNNVKGQISYYGNSAKYHEAFHGIFNLLLTDNDQKDLITKAYTDIFKELSKKDTNLIAELEVFKQQNPNRESLTKDELKALYAEEWLADKFQDFKDNNKDDSAITRFFKNLWDFIKNIFSKPNEIEKFFKDVDNGRFKGKVIVDNAYTSQVRQYGTVKPMDKIEIGFIDYEQDGIVYEGSVYMPYSHHQLLMGTMFKNFHNIANTEDKINKNDVLERILDDIHNHWGNLINSYNDWAEGDDTNNDLFETYNENDVNNLYSYYNMLDKNTEAGQGIRDDIKKEVNKLLEYIGYNQSLEDDEYLDTIDDLGDRKTTDSYSDSENFGGFKSTSKEFRQYLMTFVNESTDIFLNPPNIGSGVTFYSAPNVPTLYNGLLKATSNAGTLSDILFLKQMGYFAETNPEANAFYNRFLEDTGISRNDIDRASEDPDYKLNITNSTLYLMVKSNLQTFKIGYDLIQSDIAADKKTTRIIDANNRNSGNIQLEQWHNNFTRITKGLSKTSVIALNIALNNLKTKINGNYVISSRAETKASIEKSVNDIFSLMGIRFNPLFIEYSIYKSLPADKLSDYANEILSLYEEVVPVIPEDITEIVNSLQNGENPFISDKDISPLQEEEIETPTDNSETNPYGAKGRIFNLAKNNSLFDENVWGSVFKNAAGDNVWQHQYPTFTLTKMERIKQGLETPNKILFRDPLFQSILSKINVRRIAGLQIRTFFKSKQGQIILNNNLDTNKKEGKTYGDLQPSEMYHVLNSMYFAGRTLTVNNKKVATSKHLVRIYEASNTGDTIEFPVVKAAQIVEGKLRLSEEVLDKFYELFLEEQNTGKYLLFSNFISNLSAEKKQLYFEYNTNKLKTNEDKTKIFSSTEIKQVKRDLDSYISGTLFGEYYNSLFETNVLSLENGKIINKLMPSEIFGISGNSDTRNHLNNLHINIEGKEPLSKEQVIENIAQVFFSDYINTSLFNDMIHDSSQSEVYKGFVDIIKRAKGLNAGGPSFYTEVTNTKLGIEHGFTELDVITLAEQVRFSSISESTKRPSADGQSFATTKAFRYYMHSLGRLDKKTASIIDKIEQGTEDIDDVFGENGLIKYNRQLGVVKIVYFDGENYIKTSMFVLSPKLTSYQDDKGEWKPLPHREELHNTRLRLEAHEATGRIVLVSDSSASKTAKKNISYQTLGELASSTGPVNHTIKSAHYIRLQTENPSNKGEIVNASQSKQILDGEQDKDFFIPTVNKTVGQVAEDFRNSIGQKSKIAFIQARNDIFDLSLVDLRNELSNSIDLSKVSPKLEKFREIAVKTLQTTGANDNLITYFSKDYNLNSPLTREKYEQLFLAYFNTNGFKDKVPGHALTLASSNGVNLIKKVKTIREVKDDEGNVKRIVEWDVIKTHTVEASLAEGEDTYKNIVKRYDSRNSVNISDRTNFENTLNEGELFIDEPQYNVPVYNQEGQVINHFSEAVMPAHFKEIEFNLTQGLPIPDQILEAFSVRIPSQEKHSTASLRFVDFAPAYMGSMVFVPDEILEISGADFDVDKIYTQIREFYSQFSKSLGGYIFRSYGTAQNSLGELREFKLWNNKNNKSLKDIQKKEKEKNKERLTFLKNEIKRVKNVESNLKEDISDELQKLYDEQDIINEIPNRKKREKLLAKNEALIDRINSLNDIIDFSNLDSLDDDTITEVRALGFNASNKIIDQDYLSDLYKEIISLKQKIERISYELAKLPYTEEEFIAYKAKYGEPNIGKLNNQMLDAKILLISNEDIVSKKIHTETAEATFFLSEDPNEEGIRNHPILKNKLRPESKYEVDHILGKMSHFLANKAGADNIAPAVNSMLISFFLNKNNITLSDGTAEEPNFIPTINEVSYRNFSNNRTTTGRRVFNLISQIVTLMTDNAKERAAFKNNLSQETIPTFIYGLTLGIDENLLQAMVLRPSVIDFSTQLNKIRNSLELNKEYNSEADLIEGLLRKYDKAVDPSRILTSEDFMNFDDPIAESEVFKFFIGLYKQSSLSGKLIDILKLTKGINNGFETFSKLTESRDALGLIGRDNENLGKVFEGLDTALENSGFVNTLLKQADQLDQLSGSLILSQTDIFKRLITASMKQMDLKSYINKGMFKKNYVNDFISYLSTLSYMKQSKVFKDLNPNTVMTGDYLSNELLEGKDNGKGLETIVHDLHKARVLFQEIYDNPSKLLNKFLVGNPYIIKVPKKVTENNVTTIVYEDQVNVNNKLGMDFISGNTWSKLDEAETNDMHSDFRQMWNASSEEYPEKAAELQQIARKLYAYLIVKDGHQFKSKGISSIIPAEITKSFVNRLNYINDMFSSKTIENVQEFNNENKAEFIKHFGKDFLSLLTDYNRMYLTHKSNGNKVKTIKKTIKVKKGNKEVKDESANTVTLQGKSLTVDLFADIKYLKASERTEETKKGFVKQIDINTKGLLRRGFSMYKSRTSEGVKTLIIFPLVIKTGSGKDTKYYILDEIGKSHKEKGTLSKLDLNDLSNINQHYTDQLNLVGQKANYIRLDGLFGYEQQTPIAGLFGEQKIVAKPKKAIAPISESKEEVIPVNKQVLNPTVSTETQVLNTVNKEEILANIEKRMGELAEEARAYMGDKNNPENKKIQAEQKPLFLKIMGLRQGTYTITDEDIANFSNNKPVKELRPEDKQQFVDNKNTELSVKQLWSLNKNTILASNPDATFADIENMVNEFGIDELKDFIEKCKSGVKQ